MTSTATIIAPKKKKRIGRTQRDPLKMLAIGCSKTWHQSEQGHADEAMIAQNSS